jgi:hypothetical protein
MNRKAHILYWVAIVALLLEIARQRREGSSLSEKLRAAVIAESAERAAAKKQENELLSLRNVVSQLSPASSDESFENALELWIAKVHRLSAYLDGQGMNQSTSKQPNRGQFTVLRQVCQLIPPHLVPKTARETGVDEKSRT